MKSFEKVLSFLKDLATTRRVLITSHVQEVTSLDGDDAEWFLELFVVLGVLDEKMEHELFADELLEVVTIVRHFVVLVAILSLHQGFKPKNTQNSSIIPHI